jgi:MFS family permease
MKNWRKAIYAMQSIEGIAGGLVGIFIPIYMLTIGYPIYQIFLFYIVNNLATLPLFFLAAWLAQRIGISKLIVLRLPILLAQFYLLFNLPALAWSFYLIAILSAIDIAFYWFSLHTVFAKSVNHETMGEQVSNLMAIPGLFALLVPLVGASVSTLFGFHALFWLAGVFYIAAVVPLFFAGHIPVDVRISPGRIWDYCRRYRKYFGAEALLNAIGEVEGYVLPIFLFITFKNILSIGIIAALLGLGSAIFTLFIGRFSDRFDKRKILRVGLLAMLLIWLGRYFAVTQLQYYALSVLAGFFGVLITVPFNALIYKNAKESHVEDFVIFREIPVALGRVLLYGVGLLMVTKVKLTFLVAAGSYLLMLLF